LLKKRSKRFFIPRRFHDRGHGRDLAAGAGIKVFCFIFVTAQVVVALRKKLTTKARSLKGVTKEDLRGFFVTWCLRG
jgi:hypothetical protein